MALSRSGPLQQTAPKYKHTVGCSASPKSRTSQCSILQCNLTCAFSWAMSLRAVPEARLELSCRQMQRRMRRLPMRVLERCARLSRRS